MAGKSRNGTCRDQAIQSTERYEVPRRSFARRRAPRSGSAPIGSSSVEPAISRSPSRSGRTALASPPRGTWGPQATDPARSSARRARRARMPTLEPGRRAHRRRSRSTFPGSGFPARSCRCSLCQSSRSSRSRSVCRPDRDPRPLRYPPWCIPRARANPIPTTPRTPWSYRTHRSGRKGHPNRSPAHGRPVRWHWFAGAGARSNPSALRR